MTKYPPSRLTFVLITFGRTALFCYVLHHGIYYAMRYAGLRGLSLPAMGVLWIVGLVVAYPVCRWFVGFRQSRPARYGLSAFTMAMMVVMKPSPVVITGK